MAKGSGPFKCGSGGPSKKDGAWKRARKPLTEESRASFKQDVGKKKRQVLQRAMPELHSAMAKAKAPSAGSAMGEADKRLRALNKRLRQIEDLQKLAADGVELDAQQNAKLTKLDSILTQMEELMSAQ